MSHSRITMVDTDVFASRRGPHKIGEPLTLMRANVFTTASRGPPVKRLGRVMRVIYYECRENLNSGAPHSYSGRSRESSDSEDVATSGIPSLSSEPEHFPTGEHDKPSSRAQTLRD
ncbi:hypothetical protein J6590_021155 [Homalodisca vitripennis]|nr:hypothetical protein J6590_021155 [Homalodisca vitripennis]